MTLQGLVSVITCASSGYGRAVALAMARQGANVVCAELPTETQLVVMPRGGKALLVACDLSPGHDVASLIKRAVQSFGRLDVLVNVSSQQARYCKSKQLSHEEWTTATADSTENIRKGCKDALQQFQRQKHQKTRGGCQGKIINISFAVGDIEGDQKEAFCSANSAVHTQTRELAIMHAHKKISINAIASVHRRPTPSPSVSDHQNMSEALRSRLLQHTSNVDDVALAAVFLAGEDSTSMTGAVLTVDGSFQLAPISPTEGLVGLPHTF